MKYKLFYSLTLVLLFSSWNLKAQDKSYATKETNNSQFKVLYEFTQKAKKAKDEITLTDTMALAVNHNGSLYYDWNKQRNDSVDAARASILRAKTTRVNVLKDEMLTHEKLLEQDEPTFTSDASKGQSAKIFKNRLENNIVTLDDGPMVDGFATYLKVDEKIPAQEWKITEDTLSVLNYLCQRAETTFRGRKYNAWFTLDLPVNDGPWKLYGLPGMILKAEDSEKIFKFEAIGISKSSADNIDLPADVKTESSTMNKLKAYRKNSFKKIQYGFLVDGALTLYMGRNPIEFEEMEIGDE